MKFTDNGVQPSNVSVTIITLGFGFTSTNIVSQTGQNSLMWLITMCCPGPNREGVNVFVDELPLMYQSPIVIAFISTESVISQNGPIGVIVGSFRSCITNEIEFVSPHIPATPK